MNDVRGLLLRLRAYLMPADDEEIERGDCE